MSAATLCSTRLRGLTVVLGVLLASGMSSGSTGVVSNTPVEQPQSSVRMADRLEQIAQDSDPRRNLYLNAERARLTEAELTLVVDPATRARGLYLLAPELLLSGRTGAAIEALNELIPLLDVGTPEGAKLRREISEMLGIAYLRLGEQENCLANHQASSCLLPIRPAARHRLTSGSRQAVDQFEKILQQTPDNVTARWLLNLAQMTLGGYPDEVPPAWRIPEAMFRSETDIGSFVDRASSLGLDVVGLAGGVVVEDFDADGDFDLMCSSWGLRDPIRVYRNDAGSFREQTIDAGLTGLVGGLNLVHADYDNDGRPDVLVLRGGWWGDEGRHPNSLLRNESADGELHFRDVTEEVGLLSFHPTQTAAWADYDADGWLDLFVGNESTPNSVHPAELFHNNGDGTFTESAAALGLALTGFIKGVVWGDYNNDARPDLYVSVLGGSNRLFRNEGPASPATHDSAEGELAGRYRFVDVSAEAHVSEPIASFPTWFFDYDNDGWLDLFVSGYAAATGPFGVDYMELEHSGESPRLYRNQGNGRFADVTKSAGLDRLALTMGSGYGDLDNDGFQDFYLGTGEPDLRALTPNRMYLNEGGERFVDVTFSGGFGHLQKGHAVAFADLDQDGDQDVYEVMGGAYSGDAYHNVLFENPGHANNWIVISLEGVKSNRSAIGARLTLRIETSQGVRAIHRAVATGGSFGSTSLRQHVGLSDAQAVRRLEVYWPSSGERQVFDNLPVNRKVHVTEGESRPEISEVFPIPFPKSEH